MEALHQRLDDYMKRKGLRSTAQRRVIADTFFTSSDHLTIEDLLSEDLTVFTAGGPHLGRGRKGPEALGRSR